MGRPRYCEGELTARERIVEAFWSLLGKTPFESITVSHIVQIAQVNRNSFYYHFTDIDDLAAQAIEELMVPDVVRMVLAGMGALEGYALECDIAEEVCRLDRLGLIAGMNSSSALRSILNRTMFEVYANALNINLEALDPIDHAFLEFMLGGIIAVLAYRVTCNPTPTIADVSQSEWFRAVIANMQSFAAKHAG